MKFLGAKILYDSILVKKILSRIIQKVILKKFKIPVSIFLDTLELMENDDDVVIINVSGKITCKENHFQTLIDEAMSNS